MTTLMTSLLGMPCLTTIVCEQDLVIFTHDEQYSQIVPNGKAVFKECARLAEKHSIEMLPVLLKDDCAKQVAMIRAIEAICQHNAIQLPPLALTANNEFVEDIAWDAVFAEPLALARPTIWQSQKTLQAAQLQNLDSFVAEIVQHPANKQNYQLHRELLDMAVTENNISKVEFLLSNTILKRHRDFYQELAFKAAIKEGSNELANHLVFADLTGHHFTVVMAGLTDALENGNVLLANDLLNKKEIRQQIASHAEKLLLAVCCGGSVAALEALLANPEFAIDMAINNNETLAIACAKAHVELIDKLLTYPNVEANIACKDNRIFITACELGNVEIVKKLLNYPAVKALSTTKDNSALKGACVNGHLAVVQELLAIPEVMDTIETWQSDIMQIACISGNVEIVKALFAIKKVKDSVTVENIAINELNENCHVAVVQYLLSVLDVSDEIQFNLLHKACTLGQLEMVSALLGIKAVNAAFIKNPEAIFTETCNNHHLDIVRELLAVLGKKNTEFNIQAMRVASSGNDITLLKELLALPGVKEHAADLDNQALRAACLAGNLEVVEELLEIPAVYDSINAKDNDALVATCKSGNVELLRKLLSIPAVQTVAAANRNQAFREACFVGNTEIVAELLAISEVRENAAINQNQAIWRACLYGNLDMIRMLLTVPAIRNALRNPEGITLTAVAESGNIDLLCEILRQSEIFGFTSRQLNQALRGAIREEAIQSVHELLLYPQVIATLANNDNALLDEAIDGQNSVIIHRLLKEKVVCEKLSFKHLIALLDIADNSIPEFDWSVIIARKSFSKIELLEFIDPVSESNQKALTVFYQYLMYYGYDAIAPCLSGEDLRDAILSSIENSFKNYFQDPKSHAALLLQMRAEVEYLNNLNNSYTSLAANTESAMDPNLVREAVNRFNDKIKPEFFEQFSTMGGIPQIEAAIYAALLDKKITKLKQEATEDAAKQIAFIEQNKSALIARVESVLAIARGYFTSTTDTLDIALRALDSKAATHGWEKLFVAPSKEKAESTAFSSRAASNEALNVKQASDICREMLCYAFLVTQDASLSESVRNELFDVFVMYLAEISRAHNEYSEDTDNPSCFPGTLSRLDLIFQRHPRHHIEISVFKTVNEIASQLITKAFTKELNALKDPAIRLALYDAMVFFDHTNALAIIHPNKTNKIRSTEGSVVNLNELLKVRKKFFEKHFGKAGELGIQQIKEILQKRHQLLLPAELENMALLPLLNMSKATPSTTFSLTEAYQRSCPKAMESKQRINPFKTDFEKLFQLYLMLPELRREEFARNQFIDGSIKSVIFEIVFDIKPEQVEDLYQAFKSQVVDENPELVRSNWRFFELIIEKLCKHLHSDRKLFPTEERIQQAIATAKDEAKTKNKQVDDIDMLDSFDQASNLLTPQFDQVTSTTQLSMIIDEARKTDPEEKHGNKDLQRSNLASNSK